MARDYKNRERSPAARKEGHPLLAGVLIGLFVGLAAAIGIAYYIYNSPTPFVSKAKPAEPVPAPKAPEAAPAKVESAAPAVAEKPAAKAPEKQRFEFYDILQGKEAPVTEQEVKAAQKEPTGKLKERFFLQAGSFQTEAEADNLKAKLALMGVEAVIQTANIPDKGVWHRVRVGPFATVEELNKTRASLAKSGVQANLVKIHE